MTPSQVSIAVMRLNAALVVLAHTQKMLEELRDQCRADLQQTEELVRRAKDAGRATATERA